MQMRAFFGLRPIRGPAFYGSHPLRDDLLIVGAVAASFFLLAWVFDLADALSKWLRVAEAVELDEILLVSLALVPALAAVVWRQQARVRAAAQQAAQLALVKAANVRLQQEIDRRTAAERSLQQSVAQTERHLREIEAIYATAPIGMCSLDLDLRHIRINRTLADMNGRPVEAHLGRHLAEVVPDLADQLVPVYQAVIRTGRPALDVEVRGVTAADPASEHTWQATYYPLTGPDGAVIGVNGLVVDVTERIRMEQEAKRLAAEMERVQKLESLDLLVGGIAHDFNNLLQVIDANLELGLAGGLPADELEASLRAARQAGRRAATICRELLTYTGRSKPVFEPFDLAEMTRGLARMLRSNTGTRVPIAVRGGHDRLPVEGDESQLTQVVMNLVINAVHAVGDRPGRIDLVLSDHPDAGQVRLVCADTGCGMDEATLARVFEPFFTSKPNGRGLGLAAAKGIVRRHGGAITVTSAVGVGTTFTLTLPRAARPHEPPPDPAAAAAAAGRVYLLVDDDPGVRAITARGLTHRGALVLEACDGETACRMVAGGAAELDGCLIDYHMPGLSGAETYRRVRRQYPTVPVILISGNLVADAEAAVQHDPRATTLSKPYAISQALELFEALAAGRGGPTGGGAG